MSKLDAYVAERSRNNPEFANLIGKPQSTIARIENGSMNASTKILSEIAQATNQRLTIQFSPAY